MATATNERLGEVRRRARRRVRPRPRVVGVAFEAGQDARVMTITAFASALVFWLAHWWSEVIGEQISRRAFRVATSRVARREWPLVEAAVVPARLPRARLGRRVVAGNGTELALGAAVLQIAGWALVAGRRAGWFGCAPGSLQRWTEGSGSSSCCSRSWFTEPRRPASARPPTSPRRRARGGRSARPSESGRSSSPRPPRRCSHRRRPAQR